MISTGHNGTVKVDHYIITGYNSILTGYIGIVLIIIA